MSLNDPTSAQRRAREPLPPATGTVHSQATADSPVVIRLDDNRADWPTDPMPWVCNGRTPQPGDPALVIWSETGKPTALIFASGLVIHHRHDFTEPATVEDVIP